MKLFNTLIFASKTLRGCEGKDVNEPYTDMQRVFINSRATGAHYDGEQLPLHRYVRPRGTFLQRRLAEIRAAELANEE
jgi:hypothetical protein